MTSTTSAGAVPPATNQPIYGTGDQRYETGDQRYGTGDQRYGIGDQRGYGTRRHAGYGIDDPTGYGDDRFRALGNPTPLGWFAFSLPMFVWGLVNVNTRGVGIPNIVIGLAIFYGGVVQFAAGMWEFACGNTFGGTVFSSYAAFWLSYAAILIPAFSVSTAYSETSKFEDALGFYFMGWFIFTFLVFFSTLRRSAAHVVFFLFLTLSFLLLGIGSLRRSARCYRAGGYFAIFSAFTAWYLAAASLFTRRNSYFRLPIVGLNRTGPREGVKERGEHTGKPVV